MIWTWAAFGVGILVGMALGFMVGEYVGFRTGKKEKR